MRFLRWIAVVSLLVSGPALAQDLNSDGLQDEIVGPPVIVNAVANIAIVDTGESAIGDYQARLQALGHTVTTIPLNSNLATLVLYEVVLLPVSHANAATIGNFQALANDYIQYVQGGGCLYIGQPNPFNVGGQQAAISWAPYALTVNANYNLSDCPPTIANPQLCETLGLAGADLPFPADTVVSMAAQWNVLTRGAVTNNPGALSAAFGSGHVVVDLGAGLDLSEPETAALRERLAQLPCPTLAFPDSGLRGTAAALAARFDVLVADPGELTPLLERIARNPQAAAAVVQLLRLSEHSSVHDALVAESLVYSTLQSGPEFRAWLAARRPPRERPPNPEPACMRTALDAMARTCESPACFEEAAARYHTCVAGE